MKLKWRGEQVSRAVKNEVVKPALVEFGLVCETSSKSKLEKSLQDSEGKYVRGGGRGKRDGTLQRSIHVARPSYPFSGDDSENVGELGGRSVEPEESGSKITISLGSGIEYAIYVHEIHYNPSVRGFITRSVEENKPKFPGILKKYGSRL